ncbi:ATP-dependent nuclease [Pseudomonas aeruginosa]|uniref:ATP-dependent nuclease n=1 Tax=Pseudomonas aeruginosa TaxID=287 RepID=UPI000F51F276|nr:AAA family ATPase [Pseudomonas aeruginosa]MBH4233347.1 AAA family ATPase [Pseudomonas aeruginosa]MDU0578563.1 AAA family ATPase [Pseudomonas aeruginosa]MDU0717202.1 AAA family ATPase [Pseudomonas aeruginosa]RPT56608.1 ATP-dependent endonuclease [Pseudomonas aeruginosa]HCF1163694.1 AAA family ATPase [Pseudomonas aeruginosa]
MPAIKKIVVKNFKSFDNLTLEFDPCKNVLIGDNETGKSSLLLALDLALSASRSRVEAIGYEALLNQGAVQKFLAGPATLDLLPAVIVDVFLEEGGDQGFYGTQNVLGTMTDGLRMAIVPLIEEFGHTILDLLKANKDSFPFEYYSVQFSTFAGAPHVSYRRPVRHLMIDSSRIDSEYAAREYTRAVFGFHTEVSDRYRLENCYRQGKELFGRENLKDLNEALGDYQFALRTSPRSNLETDLVITKDGIPIENRGKGEQCFIKTNFALQKHEEKGSLHALLLEEPENHLSHTNMKRLVERLAGTTGTQLFIATHSSHICARLDLRHTLLLGSGHAGRLKDLSEATANFFMKAPDNNVLELALSKRVILVEGDAEFILMEHFYKQQAGHPPQTDDVHIISIGGTSFKRYLELGKILNIRIAAIRDNDGDYQQSCVVNYEGHLYESAKIFADPDPDRSTFEIGLYSDNQKSCDDLFAAGRKRLTVQEYMLKNKADAAFELLTKKSADLIAPKYIQEAIEWIRA